MTRPERSRVGRGRLAAPLCFLVAGCVAQPAAEQAAVRFTTVPEASAGGGGKLGSIAGTVAGAHPGQKIVLFAKSADVWWVQPYAASPYTDIATDLTWKTKVHLGTDYAALLVEARYQPPATTSVLPKTGSGVAAVAVARGAGTFTVPKPRVISFSGYDWEVRQTPSDRGGSNDYDPSNVRVDEEGFLHLGLVRRAGHWTSAEVMLTRALGYGTYLFVLRDTSRLEAADAVGLLTWDDQGAEWNHRELDIEISRWGDPESKNAQYVVQPYYVAENVARFNAPAGVLTHSFRWEPGRASFRTVRGRGPRGQPLVAHREFTSGVPIPGNERVHMNLYYFRYSVAPPENDAEVVVEKFEYLP
jgi:hypothetical protein